MKLKPAVVIITYNRPERLTPTLQAIAKLEGKPFEFLVVDSSDEVKRRAVQQNVESVGGTYLFLENKGVPYSRNASIAKLDDCDIIAFLDDDCVPQADWLTHLVSNFADENVWAVTGRIISSDTSLLFDEVASQDLGLKKKTFGPEDVAFSVSEIVQNVTKVFSSQLKSKAPAPFGIGHGGNVAFRRSIFAKIGGFNEKYWRSAEDIDMFYRVLQAGGRMIYEPKSLAVHNHPHVSTEAVSRTRQSYSWGAATFMRSHLGPRIFFMCAGRLTQLTAKYLQYKLSRKPALASSYAADLKGFYMGLCNTTPADHK